jgi:hypothetical protein
MYLNQLRRQIRSASTAAQSVPRHANVSASQYCHLWGRYQRSEPDKTFHKKKNIKGLISSESCQQSNLTPGPSPPRRGEEEIRGNTRCEIFFYNLTLPCISISSAAKYAPRAQPPKAPHATTSSPRHDTANCGVATSEANPKKPSIKNENKKGLISSSPHHLTKPPATRTKKKAHYLRL